MLRVAVAIGALSVLLLGGCATRDGGDGMANVGLQDESSWAATQGTGDALDRLLYEH